MFGGSREEKGGATPARPNCCTGFGLVPPHRLVDAGKKKGRGGKKRREGNHSANARVGPLVLQSFEVTVPITLKEGEKPFAGRLFQPNLSAFNIYGVPLNWWSAVEGGGGEKRRGGEKLPPDNEFCQSTFSCI